jgi:hypothetical protein
MKPTELQTRLEGERLEVEWDALRPHLARGALLRVGPGLPLVKAAMAVSLDLAHDVKGWLEDGQLQRLSEADTAGWSDDARFAFLIVQPFVLIQAIEAPRADRASKGPTEAGSPTSPEPDPAAS